MRRMGLIIIALWVLISTMAVQAQQGGGQFCVRAFGDTNANGKLDAGEALLTRGINVNLLNAQNVTIASALLDQSPTAAQGVVCFQFLAAGQYTIDISSADYKATTPASITTTIADDGLPTVVEFGGQSVTAPAATTETTTAVSADEAQTQQLIRILVSAAGTLIVVLGMGILGVIVYLLAFGRQPQPDPRRTTGTMRPVAVTDTGRVKKVGDTTGNTPKVE